MNWDAIGAIAELLGAVGVIASLVYLALQVPPWEWRRGFDYINVQFADVEAFAPVVARMVGD